MTTRILEKIKEVEARGVEVLLAVESGSRAWGLPRLTVIMIYVSYIAMKKTGIFLPGIKMKHRIYDRG
jgi:hypothetical protein